MFNYKGDLEYIKRKDIVDAYDTKLNETAHIEEVFSDKRMLLGMVRARKRKIEDQLLHQQHIKEIAEYTGNITILGAVERYVSNPDFVPKYAIYNPIDIDLANRSLESALHIVPIYEQYVPEIYGEDEVRNMYRQEKSFIHVKKAILSTDNYLITSDRVVFKATDLDNNNNLLIANFIDLNHRFPDEQEKQRILSEACKKINDDRLCTHYSIDKNDEKYIAKIKTKRLMDLLKPAFTDDIQRTRSEIFYRYGVTFDNNDNAWLEIDRKIYDNRYVTITGKSLTLRKQRLKQIR